MVISSNVQSQKHIASVEADAAGADGGDRADADDLIGLRQKLRKAEAAFQRGRLDVAFRSVHALVYDRIDELNRDALLERARELHSEIDRAKRLRVNQLTTVTLVAVSGVLVALAAAIPVSSIAVEGVIQTKNLVVQPKGALSLTNLRASGADLVGLGEFETSGSMLPPRSVDGAANIPSPTPISLLPPARDQSFSVYLDDPQLLLEELAVDDKVPGPVTLTALESPVRQFSIALVKASRGEFQVGTRTHLSAQGATVVQGPRVPIDFDLEPEESLRFKGKGVSRVVLRWSPATLEKQVFADQLAVSSVHFVDPTDETRSPVIGGRLRLRDLDVAPIELALGDTVTLVPNELVIRELTWHKGLSLRVVGTLDKLEVNGRSHVPSLLQWLSKNNLVLLCSAALASVVSFLWLALQRLQIIRS